MSVNAVDQTTGNTTPLAGNTNNLVGNLSALTTNTKSDAVGAINEVNANKQNATDNNLQTTNKTIVGGINELRSGLIGVGHVRTEPVTLTGGEPGTEGNFTIANFGNVAPVSVQIAEPGGAKALLPTNWWVIEGTLHVQYTILSSHAFIGGTVYVHMVI